MEAAVHSGGRDRSKPYDRGYGVVTVRPTVCCRTFCFVFEADAVYKPPSKIKHNQYVGSSFVVDLTQLSGQVDSRAYIFPIVLVCFKNIQLEY